MEDYNEAFVSMCHDVKAHFVLHLPALALKAPALTALSAEFSDELENSMDIETLRVQNLTGFAVDKQFLLDTYITIVLGVAAGTRALYLSNNDKKGAAKMSETKSSLKAMHDTDVIKYGRLVVKINTPFNPLLIDHGVTAARIGALDIARVAYEQAVQNPKNAIDQRVAYHKLSDQCIIRLRALLEKIDAEHESVKEELPLEVYAYEASRSITDPGAPNLPPDYDPEIPPLGTLLICTNPYSPGRRYKFKNYNPNESLLLNLSTNNTTMTNPPRLLRPGATSSLLSSTLAPNGDNLLIQNLSNIAIKVDVWVIEG